MKKNRILRINSLLKEVISEVIIQEVKNPNVGTLISVASVDTSEDLRHAKVYISIIGNEQEKGATIKALQSASGFIAVHASKKVSMRYFPALTFKLDTTVEKQMHIENLVKQIHEHDSKSRDTD